MFNQFYLVIILGFLAVWFSSKSEKCQLSMRNRKIACIWLCILFVIQAGFRDFEHQFSDTINYANSYYALTNIQFSDIFDNFKLYSDQYTGRDPGYKIFVKITQYIYPDFRFFLVLVATIISIPICRIFYKYCTSLPGILIAACLYEALFAGFFETGIRQTISMGFTYMALEAFQWRKYWLTLVLTFVAFTIHSTALIFVPVYFLVRLNNTKKLLITALLLAPLFMINAKQILFLIGEGTIMSGYTSLMTQDNTGTPIFSTLVVLSVLITYKYSNTIKEIYKYFDLMFVVMACAIMFVPTTWVNSNFLRIELYFLVFLMPLLSVFIDVFSHKQLTLTTKYYFVITIMLGILSYK